MKNRSIIFSFYQISGSQLTIFYNNHKVFIRKTFTQRLVWVILWLYSLYPWKGPQNCEEKPPPVCLMKCNSDPKRLIRMISFFSLYVSGLEGVLSVRPEQTWLPSTVRQVSFQTVRWAGYLSGLDIHLWWSALNPKSSLQRVRNRLKGLCSMLNSIFLLSIGNWSWSGRFRSTTGLSWILSGTVQEDSLHRVSWQRNL